VDPLEPPVRPVKHSLKFWLRLLGTLDLLALLAVILPDRGIVALNDASGLAAFPDATIAWYLARSASLMYALYGALLWFLSTDVPRYLPVIRFLSYWAIGHGCVITGLDFAIGMPIWWSLTEGPVYALAGVLLLCLARREEQSHEGT